MTATALVDAVRAGDQRAAARLITMLESGRAGAQDALRALLPFTGRAHIVGVTGPPGTGKSTLTDALTKRLRREDKRVGIVAVDPSSPFTGGAILGDRIRLMGHSEDPGVFIRSMASRGSVGGLSTATGDAVRVLDALGCDVVIIETVGAGQSEVDVVKAADTVVVVAVPGLGDSIQAIKAGLMEIADVFAVNKSDRPEADRTANEIKAMLRLVPRQDPWEPPIVTTIATDGTGVDELLGAVRRHLAHLATGGRLARQRVERRRAEILLALEARIREEALRLAESSGIFQDVVRRAAAAELSPRDAAEEILRAGVRR
ncbi:MAG: methylmalonyl Co-A mutase-associated GTPase MeaB [Armatimonadetes bacterium]|nr:methylmalonyl Co-A mutase-associated GTPase MeaB [Armatimonadota bacterium]